MLSKTRHVVFPAAVLRGLAVVALCGPTFPDPAGAKTIVAEAAPDESAAGPVFSTTGPDAANYGAAEGYPIAPRFYIVPPFAQQRYMVGATSNMDRLYPTRPVARAPSPWPFRRSAERLEVWYGYNGTRHSIADYPARNRLTGLLIARDDTILLEHYQYGRTDRDRLLSHSMVKTITAMLIGIAVEERAIGSIADPAAMYVPELRDTEYGKTSIRDLLNMSSGIAFDEDSFYDIALIPGNRLQRNAYGGLIRAPLINFLLGRPESTAAFIARFFNTRAAPPGTRFNYSSIDTEVLRLVLRSAVKMPLADYLSQKVWQPIGAESDASWVIDAWGQEHTYDYFNAVLRDYARFGRLLAHDGAWQGRQIIPRQWMLDATTAAPADSYLTPGGLSPGIPLGYGYQVWTLPGPRRMFALAGIYGQMIFVDPASKLVMVQTSVRTEPYGYVFEAMALWNALIETVGQGLP